MQTQPEKKAADMPQRDLIPFFAMTFLIAWGILALYLFASQTMVRLFGNLTGEHPLFYLAVYAPAIAALILVLCRHGLNGLRRFLSQLLIWRLPRAWTLFLIVGVPIPFFLGALVQSHPDEWDLGARGSLLVAMVMMLIKGPVEEIGWRGIAQPLLQRRMRPLMAALVLGMVWGLWHYPAFLLSGTPQSAWNFGAFFLGTIALSVIVTPLFNLSKGSLLVPVLFHFQMINPLWPDVQPFDTLFFVLLAAGVTTLNWKSMWNGADAVTQVLPDAAERGTS